MPIIGRMIESLEIFVRVDVQDVWIPQYLMRGEKYDLKLISSVLFKN